MPKIECGVSSWEIAGPENVVEKANPKVASDFPTLIKIARPDLKQSAWSSWTWRLADETSLSVFPNRLLGIVTPGSIQSAYIHFLSGAG